MQHMLYYDVTDVSVVQRRKKNMKKYVAEFIGTAVLTLFGCGSAAVSGGIDGTLGILGIAMAFGLSIVAMAYVIGDVSGCHINPAVSLGVFLNKGMSAADFAGYLVAQFLGGIAGAGILYGVISCTGLGPVWETGLGQNGFAEASYTGLSMPGAILVEVILTFVFVFTILGVTAKAENSRAAGIVIGLTLAFVHILGIPLTGTSVNPARSLGPALLVGNGTALSQVWVFIAAPLLGAVIAAVVYRTVCKREE
ncbi:MIP/aquaporin family protein [[Clostridium] hylemonae]|uniref:MIP family channel protein n=1 Tax=[Clostridium] hylemonae DSM 15053 TaxID=553973 RepID=C0C167_9FIRM|nr:aquaporin [[Clostridium] hylemonae]EEG73881.1 MIP family channel protein [[Clostridium] hylemonae DSM 15053]